MNVDHMCCNFSRIIMELCFGYFGPEYKIVFKTNGVIN